MVIKTVTAISLTLFILIAQAEKIELSKLNYVVCPNEVIINNTLKYLPEGNIGQLYDTNLPLPNSNCFSQQIEFEQHSVNATLEKKSLTLEVEISKRQDNDLKSNPDIKNDWSSYFKCWSKKEKLFQLHETYKLNGKKLSRSNKNKLNSKNTEGGVICGQYIDLFKNFGIKNIENNYLIYKTLSNNENFKNKDYLKILIFNFEKPLEDKLSLESLYKSYFDLYFSHLGLPAKFKNLSDISFAFSLSQKKQLKKLQDSTINLKSFPIALKKEDKIVEAYLKEQL